MNPRTADDEPSARRTVAGGAVVGSLSPERQPGLRLHRPEGDVRALALVLPGGAENSLLTARPWSPAAVRMRPFVDRLRREGAAGGLAVGLVGYRYVGWNAPHEHPVADARWALDEARRLVGRAMPTVLVGHSMGGRTVMRVADDPDVRGVVALAPWLPRDEPVGSLAGRDVLILHGDRDRTTSPRLSYRFAVQAQQVAARVCCIELHGTGHAMLRRARDWHRLAAGFALATVGAAPLPAGLAEACAAGTVPVSR